MGILGTNEIQKSQNYDCYCFLECVSSFSDPIIEFKITCRSPDLFKEPGTQQCYYFCLTEISMPFRLNEGQEMVLIFDLSLCSGLGMSVSKFSRELMYFEQVRISLMTILPLQASAIGIAMAINGIWTIACQVLFLNRLRRLLGVSLSYKLLSLGWPLVWFFMPLLRNVLTSTESPVPPLQDVPDTKTSHHRYHPVIYPEERAWPTTICVNLYLMFATVVAMSSSLLMVLVNYASPDKTALGAINGIGTAAGVSIPLQLHHSPDILTSRVSVWLGSSGLLPSLLSLHSRWMVKSWAADSGGFSWLVCHSSTSVSVPWLRPTVMVIMVMLPMSSTKKWNWVREQARELAQNKGKSHRRTVDLSTERHGNFPPAHCAPGVYLLEYK